MIVLYTKIQYIQHTTSKYVHHLYCHHCSIDNYHYHVHIISSSHIKSYHKYLKVDVRILSAPYHWHSGIPRLNSLEKSTVLRHGSRLSGSLYWQCGWCTSHGPWQWSHLQFMSLVHPRVSGIVQNLWVTVCSKTSGKLRQRTNSQTSFLPPGVPNSLPRWKVRLGECAPGPPCNSWSLRISVE